MKDAFTDLLYQTCGMHRMLPFHMFLNRKTSGKQRKLKNKSILPEQVVWSDYAVCTRLHHLHSHLDMIDKRERESLV